jgi:ParB-like chromosome segregation protein Spo0J
MAEIVDIHDLKPHKDSAIFAPPLQADEYERLKSDIAERGIQDALQVCGNVILCGHNRYRIALELGLTEVPVERKEGLNHNQQILHAGRDNLLRRQMDPDQRTLLVTNPEYRKAYDAEAARKRKEGASKGGKSAPGAGRGKKKAHKDVPKLAQASERDGPKTRDLLAEEAHVSHTKIDQGTKLWAEAPEKAEEIITQGAEAKESVARIVGEMRRRERASESQKIIEQGSADFSSLFKLQRYDVWGFQGLDPGFGRPWPGNIPASLVANVLYYFTEKGALVIDPMAGGGVTGDVCKALGRECLMSDINPSAENIMRHDIGSGLVPETEGKADLVFLDPPYWTLKDSEYSKDGAASMKWIDWCNWLISLSAYTWRMLKVDGYAAALMQDNLTKDVNPGQWSTPSTLELHKAMESSGMVFQIEISVPLSTQQVTPRDMEWARLNRRILGIRRSLLIYQKK